MADTKISALTAVVTPAGTDELAVNQAGTSKKLTVTQLLTLVPAVDLTALTGGAEATPSLAWGDSDTGLYESSANVLMFANSGSNTFSLHAGGFWAQAANGPGIFNEGSTATNPTLVPLAGDNSTGIGGTVNTASIISKGIEVARAWSPVAGDVQLIIDPGRTSLVGAPGLAFGDGDSGFYESADDTIKLALSGLAHFQFTGSLFAAETLGGGAVRDVLSTATVPTLAPNNTNTTAGLGGTVGTASLIAGSLEALRALSPGAGDVQVIIDPAGGLGAIGAPSLAFGDGDTGFWENSDDLVQIIVAGAQLGWIDAEGLSMANGTGPQVLNEASSGTNPTLVPKRSDQDTGVGSTALDQLALVAGGVEGVRVTEAAAAITVDVFGALTATSYDGVTAANLVDKSADEVLTGHWSVPSTINTQNGDYTLVIGDAGKTIHKVSGGAGETITIPANASVAYPTGVLIKVENDGGGTLTVAITTDTLTFADDNTTGSRTIADGGFLVMQKMTSTTWKCTGAQVT